MANEVHQRRLLRLDNVKGAQGAVVKKAPRFVRVLGFRHSTGILSPGEVRVVPERARMWKARREAEELQLPGRGMALPEVHLLRQGRSLSATPRLVVVSMR